MFGWPIRVTQYLGISLDEAIRMRQAKVAYITNSYPLVEERWGRNECQLYLKRRWPDVKVGRSSC